MISLRFGFLSIVLLLLITFDLSLAECPEAGLLKPCICDTTLNSIICSNITKDFDFNKHFTNVSKYLKNKIFSTFTLKNSFTERIGVKIVADLRFGRFEFINNTKLVFISQDMFGDQTPFVKELVFEDSPITNPPEDFDLFDATNRMASIHLLDLSGTQLVSIPDDSFVPILFWYPFELKELLFCKPTQKCRSIRTVGKKVIYYFNELEIIDLSRHRIDFIDDFAFSLHNISEKGHKLDIKLDDNHLNGSSFTENSFQFIGKPTVLSLVGNQELTFLRQEVFEPFLEDNPNNELYVTKCPIDFNSVHMNWFKTLNENLKKRIHF